MRAHVENARAAIKGMVGPDTLRFDPSPQRPPSRGESMLVEPC